MSGFTTTGATILTDIEAMPRGILFWRSLTHWLGGMGIITLAIAILPAFGIASYQMFRGEIPGPTTERLKPRLNQTAKILWGAYAVLTLLETGLLMLGGMTLFDALCHSFGTMATGGFSTRNSSIAAYNNPFIHWVIIVFMFFAGMNFVIHYRIIFTRKFDLIKTNREFRFYLSVIVAAVLIVAVILSVQGVASGEQISRSFRSRALSQQELGDKASLESERVDSPLKVLRHSAFQVISLTTTTGYTTADFDTWPNFIRYLLVILMFFGGCAGSTGGGIKMIRIMVILKTAWREVRVLIQPRLILPLKIAGKTIEEKQVANIIGFVVLFLALFVILSLIMGLFIGDFTTAISSVVSTICNIGPGLSGIGATENYAWMPLPGKWVLVVSMLLGRLEIYTVLIAFAPLSWKK
jgi:trk system potassium uptake protein TrkH